MCASEETEDTEKIHNEGTKRAETNEVFTKMAILHYYCGARVPAGRSVSPICHSMNEYVNAVSRSAS
jgi:hypothetical protein